MPPRSLRVKTQAPQNPPRARTPPPQNPPASRPLAAPCPPGSRSQNPRKRPAPDLYHSGKKEVNLPQCARAAKPNTEENNARAKRKLGARRTAQQQQQQLHLAAEAFGAAGRARGRDSGRHYEQQPVGQHGGRRTWCAVGHGCGRRDPAPFFSLRECIVWAGPSARRTVAATGERAGARARAGVWGELEGTEDSPRRGGGLRM